jgi:hypothetical protein
MSLFTRSTSLSLDKWEAGVECRLARRPRGDAGVVGQVLPTQILNIRLRRAGIRAEHALAVDRRYLGRLKVYSPRSPMGAKDISARHDDVGAHDEQG